MTRSRSASTAAMRTSDPTGAAVRPRARVSTRPANPTLRALLEETEWTQAAFAHAITRLGAEVGLHLRYDRTSVAHWLRGSRPEPRVQHLMAEALSRRLGRPVTVPELGMRKGRVGTGQRPQRSQRGAAADDGGETGEGGDPSGDGGSAHPVDRLTALTAPVVAPPRADAPPPAPYKLKLLTTSPRQPRPARTSFPVRPDCVKRQPGTRPVGPSEVASVHEHARFFAQQADRHGGGHIRTSLAAHLSGLVRSLRTGEDSAHHRGLLAGAARLSFLLARVYADEQRHGLAQRAFLTSAELAAEADDQEGVALALRALSSQAHHLGHLRESLALAEAACDTAPVGTAPSARSFLYAGLAVAQAAAGERDRSMSALRRAEQQLARAPEDLTTGPRSPNGEPVGSYQDAALLYQSSQVRGALGDRTGAIRDLRASLRSRPVGERRSRAVCLAELAELLLSCGRLEEACASWQSFLDDCALVHSGRALEARTRMPGLLRPYVRERCVQVLLSRTSARAGARTSALASEGRFG